MGLKDRLADQKAARAAELEAATPRARARAAFENGDPLFQAVLAASGANAVLNEIAAEGWALDQMAVGWVPKNTVEFGDLTTAARGTMMGYYVFVRR